MMHFTQNHSLADSKNKQNLIKILVQFMGRGYYSKASVIGASTLGATTIQNRPLLAFVR